MRFRIMSRDAFSNTARSEKMEWYLRVLFDDDLRVETSIQHAGRLSMSKLATVL
jgi:hypothetical protein